MVRSALGDRTGLIAELNRQPAVQLIIAAFEYLILPEQQFLNQIRIESANTLPAPENPFAPAAFFRRKLNAIACR
jgi:hypothetical protein